MSRNPNYIRIIFLILPLFFYSAEVFADESIRCNGSLIDLGELVSTVLHKCGEPTDTVEYTVHSTIHQRFIVSQQTHKRILVDEFQVQSDFEKPSESHTDDLNGKDLHSELTRQSRDSSEKKFTYKNYKINRRIINTEYVSSLNSQYVYWETEQIELKMKRLIYNLGSNQFIRVLTFKNGVLWKMDFKEYGY